ncbi:hypothetical protein RhiirC2_870586 [Rhizophagus irregularis]|uniref:Uncharacterized protein n=1 Tax=Rhizophagus irregularis TaxID=588596 RepID=A0A2N1MIE2_9GLOM|nr:hypothetical protein RhiirC2_870586 [Rhizophagus irregularis]
MTEIPILKKKGTYKVPGQTGYHSFFKVTNAEQWNFSKFVTFLINTNDDDANPKCMADNDCKMIQSALRSLEKLSTSRLVFEPKIALAKQIAGTSEELCSIATSGKRDRVLKSLCSKVDWKQIRGNRLHLAEEGLLEMLKPVLQKKNDKQSLLQNFAQVWINMGKGDVTLFEQYTLLVIHIFINEFTSKRNVLSHPSTTEAMWSTIMSFITGKAIRDGDMEYTWGEIVTCPCSANDVGIQKRVISANQGWNNLKSRYEANNSQESSDEEDDYTKQTPKK